MKKKMATGLVLAFAALTSLAAISSAQQGGPWSGQFPDPDDEPWQNWDNWENYYSWQGQWQYNTPTTVPGSEPKETYSPTGTYSDSPPTTDRPGGSPQPMDTPLASTSLPISSFDEGELLSESDLESIPGWEGIPTLGGGFDEPLDSGSPDALSDYYGGGPDYYGIYYSGSQDRYGRYYGGTQAYYGGYYGYGYGYGGLQHLIYYCGRWTYGPAALVYGQQTNTITQNYQYQYVWYYDRYPDGHEQWEYGGYWYPGPRFGYFRADQRGWHQIAIWGSRSGWSNPIWVYVW